MKMVIAGSARNPEAIQKWITRWKTEYDIVDYVKPINPNNLTEEYKEVFITFYQAITQADVLFVANEKRNDIEGYIGNAVFAEIAFSIAQKIVHGQEIKVVLAHEPSPSVNGYDELILWKKLGWINLMEL
jgi:hypothetical protein